MPIRKRYLFSDVEGIRVGRINLGINTTFIIYRLGDTLMDAGPSNQWPEVRSFLQQHPVRQLFLSHHHEDHSGNAARISEWCQLMPYAPQQAIDKFTNGYPTPLLQKLIWGSPMAVHTQPLPEQAEVEGYGRLQPIHTPGHAKDLHCFYLPERGWLFSGDLYIAQSVRMLRKDEKLDQIMTSIAKVLKLDFEVLFCPHRGVVEEGKQALTDKLNRMLALCQRAKALHQQGYDEKEVIRVILGPEEMLTYLSGFNFSKRHLIRQAIALDDRFIESLQTP